MDHYFLTAEIKKKHLQNWVIPSYLKWKSFGDRELLGHCKWPQKKKKMESLIDDIEPLILKKANSEFTVSKFQAFDKLHAL